MKAQRSAVPNATYGPPRSVVGRQRLSWALSAAATLTWLIWVLAAGLIDRVVDKWVAGVTMLFGSFLSGSTPIGGSAVAFPVFTKGLDVPAPVARTFGLSIQSIGMTAAVVSIVLFRRAFHGRAVAIAVPAAVVGFVASVGLLGQRELAFWDPTIGTPWVKATFTIVLATTSILMIRHLVAGGLEPLRWTRRLDIALVGFAFAGGFLASLTGTGANILVFLLLVFVAGVDPKVALPTAVMVMAAVSVVGLLLLGVIDGQLDLVVAGDRVVEVGGHQTDLAASEADLLGLWLAAVPVVVWGAPLGSLAASMVKNHQIVGFVAILTAVEVLTTIVLVPELRTNPTLAAYLVTGLVVLPVAFVVIQRHRGAAFATVPASLERPPA